MKKTLLLLACAVFILMCLCSCGNESVSGPTNEEFFAITELINNGEYEQAKAALDEAYAKVDYASRPAGFNKMNQYRFYYVSQGLYDDAMTVLLDFLKANDFVNYLEDIPADNIMDDCVYAIRQVNSILELVSDEKKAEAIGLVGLDLLNKYNRNNDPSETDPVGEEIFTSPNISDPSDSQSIPPDWNDEPNVNDAPHLFHIGGKTYSITSMNREFVQNEFPDAEDYMGIGLIDTTTLVVFLFDNYGDVNAVYLYSETDSLYKNVRVGMTESEITDILGPTNLKDNSGGKYWGYDIDGNKTDDESSCAYMIVPIYDADGKVQLMTLAYAQQTISEMILVSVEYNYGLIDLSGRDAEIYLDGTYMVTIPSGDTRILMIPYDEQTHKITVKKYGYKTESATFGPENYSTMDDNSYCVGYKTSSSMGYMYIEETDFNYTLSEFIGLYVLLIDGQPVEMINIEPENRANVLRDFASQH